MTVVAFKVLHLGSYTPIPAPSSPFKTILELILWNGLQRCRCITRDVIKMPSLRYFLYLREQKKVTGARSSKWGLCSSSVIRLLAKNSLTDSALIQAPTFSRRHTKTHTQTIIDATQKETAIDQQQHSCETLIRQRHETILRLLSTAVTANAR
jgi:hypothetical protein